MPKKVVVSFKSTGSPIEFEELADAIDRSDNAVNSDNDKKLQKYREMGRPYMLSAGIDQKIRFVFTMSPLMTKVATESDFIYSVILHMMNASSIHIFLMLTPQ